MKETNDIIEELEALAPLLSQQKRKKEAFKIPPDYFKSLEEQLVNTSREFTQTPLSKPTSNIIRLSNAMLGKVAAILLLLGGSFVFWQRQIPPSMDDSLSSNEITAYIADNLSEFDEDFLLEYDRIEEIATIPYPIDEIEVEIYLEEILEEVEVYELENFLLSNH